jgi:superfamily II DNA/RNA helicase
LLLQLSCTCPWVLVLMFFLLFQGKTIQAIALIGYLMEFKNNLGPYLVIVPLSTLSNWSNEFAKWCPSAHVICYKGTPAQRKELYKEQVRNGHFNILLTTYEYIIKDKASLRKITWQYAIVDEGHRMKNAASKFAKTLSTQYETKYRLLLTGTPLMNELSELWSLLNFLLPTIFNSVDTFDTWFNRPFSQFGNDNANNTEEENLLSNEERMFIIHRLHELLRPFMLRRVKSEVLDQLPEKVEKILRCELSSWQKELYKQISKKAVVENGSFVEQTNARGLNNVVMQLRKVCNHPYLFSPEGYHINENVIRSSAKFELLDRMLPKLRAAGHRVLMFTQMTAVMTILEDYFAYRGFMSLRLDGSTPAEEREKRMYKFNAPDSPYFIFLLSTRAGGLGLNLTAANTVIIFDSDWNPMMDLQAQDRAHRIGQRSEVSVFRLVTYSPVEEKILSRATEKLNMSELVVEAGQFDKRSVENDNSLERKKMMEVLLTDFSTNTSKLNEEKAASELTGSDFADDDDDDDDNGSEDDKEEDLNDLLSNNETDYQLYRSFDKQQQHNDVFAVDTSLFTCDDDVPDWIKYPKNKNNATLHSDPVAGDGPRKKKKVVYDDGLTEKQFMRMMDKQFDGESVSRDQAKAVRRDFTGNGAAESSAAATTESDLTDWTFRKLISCTKAVIALKDPSTKRRLSDIFMEKPSPEQFPDYYEHVKKPIAINDILRKCRGKLYADVQEYREDWKLIVANATQFNGDGSWVVEDGNALIKELERVLKKNGINDEMVPAKPKTPPPKPKKKLRIKLSLKSLKAKESASRGDDGDQVMRNNSEETPTSKGKLSKKRKKV